MNERSWGKAFLIDQKSWYRCELSDNCQDIVHRFYCQDIVHKGFQGTKAKDFLKSRPCRRIRILATMIDDVWVTPSCDHLVSRFRLNDVLTVILVNDLLTVVN